METRMAGMREFFLVVLLIPFVVGHQICKQDTDCMGELICVKSACEWGVCACARGYASRFNGSKKRFQCVKMKKIGEKCSTEDDDGVCGAANSDCVDDKCSCTTGYEARWGGEECLSVKTPYPMETCSNGLGATCQGSTCAADGAWNGAYSGSSVSDLPNVPFDDVPNVCACGTGYHTLVPNDYDEASFVGANVPTCEKNKVGDRCVHAQDCSQIQKADGSGGWTTTRAASCTDNKCRCADIAHSSDITGLFCAQGLNYGDSCMSGNSGLSSAIGVCNGAMGLRCGDQCDLDTALGTGNHLCKCDASYRTDGTSCLMNEIGSSCYGDLNCKGIGYNALCVDGECQAGSGHISVDVLLLAFGVFTTWLTKLH